VNSTRSLPAITHINSWALDKKHLKIGTSSNILPLPHLIRYSQDKKRRYKEMTANTGIRNGMVVAGPIIGLVYVIFLPFIALAMLPTLIVARAMQRLRNVSHFGWRHSEAYLTGRKTKK